MKIATITDRDEVIAMAKKFTEASPYQEYVTEARMDELTDLVLGGDLTKAICILEEGKGMIAGIVSTFPFGDCLVCTELLWWVEPDFRMSKVGAELLGALEVWARKLECRIVTMVSLDDGLGKYYEKLGYSLKERTYMKELN